MRHYRTTRAALVAPLLALAFIAPGCGLFNNIGRNLGRGLVTGARDRQAVLDSLTTEVVRSAGQGLDSVRAQLQRTVQVLGHQLNASLDTALDSIEQRTLRMQDSLAGFVDDQARRSVNHLLASNLQLVRDTVRNIIAIWSTDLANAMDRRLAPALRRTTASVLDTATLRLAASLDSTGELSITLVALSDRIVRQAVRALADESGRQKTPTWVWIAAAAAALLVLAAVGRFVLAWRREHRDREKSLNLVSRAIQERGDPRIAERIQSLAKEQGVEQFLHKFLEDRRLLVASPGGQSA